MSPASSPTKRYGNRLLGLFLLLGLIPGVAMASPILFYKDFQLHDTDAGILRALAIDNGSVLYFKEFASITQAQAEERKKYEPIGCYPFTVMRDGVQLDSGYNCMTFYCIGYKSGPKQCRNREDQPYGGVVEIDRRLKLFSIDEIRKEFASFPESQQTSSMRARTEELGQILCKPFFLMRFDVAVGEGYSCEEVGRYPKYSSANVCTNDWRTTKGLSCSIPLRKDEDQIRRDAIKNFPPKSSSFRGTASSVVSRSSSGSAASQVQSSASSAPVVIPEFPDVEVGKYGYTAIITLASRGILKGYPDGKFYPTKTINRAEFSKMLFEALHPIQLRGEADCFPDVRQAWFSPYVCAAKRLGWIQGYADGKFRPERTMTKAEGLKIIVASLGLPLDSKVELPVGFPNDAWFSPYVSKAIEVKVLLESGFQTTQAATRADAAVWMYRAAKLQGIF